MNPILSTLGQRCTPGPRTASRALLRAVLALGLLAMFGVQPVVAQDASARHMLARAPAQIAAPPQTLRIGLLTLSSLDAIQPGWILLVNHLGDLGYTDGENLFLEPRAADGDASRLPELAGELVDVNVDIIVAAFTPAVLAAMHATTTIPIVIPFGGDPVGSGLVQSLERPGGNVTGLSNLAAPGSSGRFKVLSQLLPQARRLGLVINARGSNPTVAPSIAATQVAAQRLGVEASVVEVADASGLTQAIDQIAAEGGAGLVFYWNPLTASTRTAVLSQVALRNLPAVYETADIAQAGGLVAYGPNILDLWRRAADYILQISNGADPAELAIGLPERYDLVINLKTAATLGLTVPQELVDQATELIR